MKHLLAIFLPALTALTLISCHPGPAPKPEITGEAMTMPWRLQLPGVTDPQELEQAKTWIREIMTHWELATSHWHPDSEVSQFNNTPRNRDWQPLSHSLFTALHTAQQVAEQTDSALDITLLPLSELWGFGPKNRHPQVPSAAEIQALMPAVGWSCLEIDPTQKRIRRLCDGTQINVAAIVEGLVLDAITQRLEQAGYRHFLLEFGGEVVARGSNHQGEPWLVGVQQPNAPTGTLFRWLELKDQALSTSGSYRHFWDHNGRRYPHLIDPETGAPIQHRAVSVSVIHSSAAMADAYATALLVLGPERGSATAERWNLETIWITEHEKTSPEQ